MHRKDIERIESYLNGKLKGPEKTAFEQRMEQDPVFRREVAFHRDVLEGIKMHGQHKLSEKIQNWEAQAESATGDKPVTLNRWRTLGRIAAAALALFLCWFIIQNRFSDNISTRQLVEIYLEEAPESNRVLKNETAPSLLDQAFEKYDREQFAESLPFFEEALQNEGRVLPGLFYAAFAYLKTGQFQKAIEYFQRPELEQNATFRRPAQWYLALAYLKTGNMDEAKKILTQITEDPSDKNRKKALELLRLAASE